MQLREHFLVNNKCIHLAFDILLDELQFSKSETKTS
jgi:hypothetical protein